MYFDLHSGHWCIYNEPLCTPERKERKALCSPFHLKEIRLKQKKAKVIQLCPVLLSAVDFDTVLQLIHTAYPSHMQKGFESSKKLVSL